MRSISPPLPLQKTRLREGKIKDPDGSAGTALGDFDVGLAGDDGSGAGYLFANSGKDLA
jgi:hypothetical protein